jgi:hypothetical protein
MARKLSQGEAYILFNNNPVLTKVVFNAKRCHARQFRRLLGGRVADNYFPDLGFEDAPPEEIPPIEWF